MNCCNCGMGYIANILNAMNSELQTMNCSISSLEASMGDISNNTSMLYAVLAANNPMTVAGEYPTEEADKVVYSTIKVRFLDMLNPNMVAIFKGTFDVHKPVYFKDTINYEHIVTIGDISTVAYADDLVNNYNYPALYVGNYIILDPTAQTLQDFKDGLLS